MNDIRAEIVGLLKSGYCTPQIAQLARRLKHPSTTLHYNIHKLEEQEAIIGYRAVFNHKNIGAGFCAFVLITLSPDEYGNPERIAKDLAKYSEIESIDIVTGDWEMILKVRTKDMDAYYAFVKNVISRKGIIKISSLNSMKQIKSEFVTLSA